MSVFHTKTSNSEPGNGLGKERHFIYSGGKKRKNNNLSQRIQLPSPGLGNGNSKRLNAPTMIPKGPGSILSTFPNATKASSMKKMDKSFNLSHKRSSSNSKTSASAYRKIKIQKQQESLKDYSNILDLSEGMNLPPLPNAKRSARRVSNTENSQFGSIQNLDQHTNTDKENMTRQNSDIINGPSFERSSIRRQLKKMANNLPPQRPTQFKVD